MIVSELIKFLSSLPQNDEITVVETLVEEPGVADCIRESTFVGLTKYDGEPWKLQVTFGDPKLIPSN